MMNGRYARAEDLNGKPKFRQVGGSSVLQFEDGWKMKGAEMSEHSYYHPDDVALPPTGDWSAVGGGESPRVSLLHSPISSAPRFFWVQGAGGVGEQTNGCYVCIGSSNGKPKYWQMDGAGIIYFRGTWRINYRDPANVFFPERPLSQTLRLLRLGLPYRTMPRQKDPDFNHPKVGINMPVPWSVWVLIFPPLFSVKKRHLVYVKM